MAHIKRIDLTRDVEAHADAYREAIEKVCRETAFSGGKYADTFDKEFAAYVGSRYASGVNNGTSALHLAMLALGVGPGDEVIVPANTYIATAWGVSYTGATPVFADCTPDTWEIDPSVLEAKITERTKGIIGVHLYGQPFDYAGVREIADRHGLFVVEDCAQAHGAQFEGKNVGTLGDLACFSLYPGKNLYAFGEGGSVTCEKEEYYKHIDRLKNQGCDVRYYHDEIGYNYRLEGVQGAVLSVSLKYLPEWTKRRQEIGHRYIREITNPLITMQRHPENTTPVFHLFVITVPDHEDFIRYMQANRSGEKEVKAFDKNGEYVLRVDRIGAKAIKDIQSAIDEYLKAHGGTVDYIHGIGHLKDVASRNDGVAIAMPKIEKEELFDYVLKNGTLCRKAFSMGEAEEKRYYFEAKKIK